MDFRHAKRFFKEGEEYLITTHVQADGDGIGSILALAGIVEQMGKTPRLVIHDREADVKYRFLPGFDRIEPYSRSMHEHRSSHVLVADSPGLDRIGEVRKLIDKRARILNVDHHTSNLRFGSVNLVDETASSTAELVLFLANALRIHIEQEMAAQLYTGILFDTGCFRYSNRYRAFSSASSLVDMGADPVGIADAVYAQRSFRSVKVLGEALSTLELHFKGRAAILSLPYRAVRNSVDLDGIVDTAISISGVELAAFLKEQGPRKFRVSLRSRGSFNVNELAKDFKGGGHPNASGCSIEGETSCVKRALLKAIRKRLVIPG